LKLPEQAQDYLLNLSFATAVRGALALLPYFPIKK
jgi:hypothetical protein